MAHKMPEQAAWNNARHRCANPNHVSYPMWGGRGIGMYWRWMNSFKEFYDYIGPRPSNQYSLERINNDGHYEPGNVKWATKKEQQNNCRHKGGRKRGEPYSVDLTWQGETRSLSGWARHLGISGATIARRHAQGRSIEEILSTTRLPRGRGKTK